MPLLCKQKALYVKGCVIANGVTDSQGDTLYSEDIKKIFTSFNNQDNFEVYHNDIPIQEVSLLENYISVANETIGTAVVPSGSWMCVIRVDNPEIQEGLLTGEFGGLSLNNRIAEQCKANLHGQVRYQDIVDAECVIPLLISFVKRGANGYGLHVYDYDAYIKKSNTSKRKEHNRMAFNLLDGLKSLIEKAEASETEEVVILKEDSTEDKEEEQVEIKKEDNSTEEEPSVKKEDTEEDTEEEETEITKEDDNEDEISLEDRVAKLEEQLAELLAEKDDDAEIEKEDEEEATEEEPVDEDTPKITKSEKVVIVENTASQNTNYFEMTGRDPLTGMKIRNQSKILK